jgi:formiminotetrahydrofolate cyclodeaminase
MDAPNVSLAGLTLSELSERLASAGPVPGGGSASAIVGSLGASLLAMVARLSLDRPKYESYRSTNEHVLSAAEVAREELLRLADDDTAAYGRFAAARRMPKETEEQQQARNEATRAAARESSDVPMSVVRECVGLLEEILSAAGRSNLNAASDLEVAARLAAAAARGAAANVLINLPMVGDERYLGATTAELNGLLEASDRMLAHIVERVAGGVLREPEAE